MSEVEATQSEIVTTPPPVAITPKQTLPRFGQQVDSSRAAQSTVIDSDAAKVSGQVGQDLAAANNEAMLRAAQKIAIQLGVDGVVTVDDVTRVMADQSYNVLPKARSTKRHNWKGKIFPVSKWVKVGEVPATLQSSHGRPIGQWVTKDWIRVNSLNGRVSTASGYALIRIYKDFDHLHKPAIASETIKLVDCNWYIGDERVDSSFRKDIQADGNKLYGIPVSFIPGAIGAVLLPPDPSKIIKPV